MTSFTPVYGLEYPDALDEPCDFPEDWCTFTADVDAVLDRFELGASRVLPAIPIAKVTITEPVSVGEGLAFTWDTVAVDTAGWTNFDVNNTVITVSRTARYSIVASAVLGPQGAVNSGWVLIVNGPSFINNVEALDRNTQEVGITSESEVQTIVAGTAISVLAVRNGSSGDVPVLSASLTVFWHADEERP